MKKLYIMRGLPGSGKTKAVSSIVGAVVCSADDFSMENGEYKFNPRTIHEACKEKALRAMAKGEQLVIVDNTNTQKWEYKLYLAMADVFGYEVKEIVVGGRTDEEIALYAERNTHGVPLEAIKRMAERWED